jgi:AcrR family transcriptional regulator
MRYAASFRVCCASHVRHDAGAMPTQVQRTAAARQRLIAATRELVAAQGVGNTSVAAIGERAGMSRGAVNFHFGSKDDLLVAVSEEVTNDWESQALAGAVGLPFEDVDALVDALVTAWLGELHTNPERVRIVVMLLFEALGPSPHLHEHFVILRRRVRDRIGAFVAARQRAGQLSGEIDAVGFASLFLGLLLGVAVTHLLDPESSSLDAAISEARITLFARLHT